MPPCVRRPYTFSMENETPPQRERTPLDVFDPTADGHEPHTLADVVQRGQEILDSIDSFQAALLGCMTPLDLATEYGQAQKLRKLASEVVEPVRKARDIIELDLPLATGEQALSEDRWAPPQGSVGTLRPEEILALRLRARQVGPSERTTYRTEVEKQSKIPWLIQRDRRRAAAAARRAVMTDEQKEARREIRRRSFSPAPESAPASVKEEAERLHKELESEMDWDAK